MKSFKNGVSWYTRGTAIVDVHFPEDDVCCSWCPFCRAENDLGRFWCRLTNQMIYNPYTERDDDCPIILENEGERYNG